MLNIPINSPLGYVGILALAFGFFLILSGLDIVKIDQITVARGSRAWSFGLVLAVVGLMFLWPDLHNAFTPRAAPGEQTASDVATPSPATPVVVMLADQAQVPTKSTTTPLLRAPSFITTARSGVTQTVALPSTEKQIANVLRHAQVAECLVTLQIDGRVRLVLDEASQGLPTATGVGVELPATRQQSEELWGTYTLEPNPAGGTQVNLELPLRYIAQNLLHSTNGRLGLTLARWSCG
jgi:hypothetical protein